MLNPKNIMSNNLKQLLSERDMNPKDLSNALKLPYNTVLSWVNGVTYPRPDKVEKLATYFNVTCSALVDPPASSNVNINGDNNSINGTINTGTIGNVTTIDGNITINHQGTVSEVHQMYQSLSPEARGQIDSLVKTLHDLEHKK